MDKRRLLILLPASQLYGQERALITVAQIMRCEGFECQFLTHAGWGDAVARHVEDLGFKSIPLPLGTLWSLSMARREPGILFNNVISVVLSTVKFLRIVKRFRPDYLLTGNATFTYYFLPAVFLTKMRVIYRHGDDLVEHSAFHRILNKILFKRVAIHVANCQYLARNIKKKYPRIDIKTIYNLPSQLIAGEKPSASLISHRGHQKQILYVGQIAEHKGIMLLMQAFEMIALEYPDLSLVLIGDAPGVDQFKPHSALKEIERCMNSFPEQIIYLGQRSDVDPYYQAADIHVCPSVYEEPSPNVIFEAKYYGLPSVVFPVGGIPELVRHKVDGFVCAKVDAISFAAGIRYFLESDSARISHGIAAHESLEKRFGVNRFREQWSKVFSERHLK